MNNTLELVPELEEFGDRYNVVTFGSKPESLLSTWATCLSCLVCIAIFLAYFFGPRSSTGESWERMTKFGWLPANAVWNGQFWALITSAFVHLEWWHIALNVYWLWVLGSRLERTVGSPLFVAFVLISAFISSSCQMSTSDSTGIGASGVGYAIFGFMWVTRKRFLLFDEVLDLRTRQLFVGWLFACIPLTYLGIFNVGNAAHISGLLFGCSVGSVFVLRFRPWLNLFGLIAIVAFSIVPLFWCPWSVTWLSEKAYAAQMQKRYDEAIRKYDQVIKLSPKNAWAFLNRGTAYQALGLSAKARADWDRAHELDPSMDVPN